MSFNDPSTLCLFLLAGVAVALMFRTRVRLGRQRGEGKGEAGAGGSDARQNPEMPLPDDLAAWEVQMHETARQLSAQLDAKLSLLQSLVAEAGRVAQRLEDALDRAPPALPPGSQAESLLPVADRPREYVDKIDAPGTELDRPSPDIGQSAGNDRSRLREETYHLADYGFTPAEIARRVGSPVGEVELMLSLREK